MLLRLFYRFGQTPSGKNYCPERAGIFLKFVGSGQLLMDWAKSLIRSLTEIRYLAIFPR